MSGAARFASDLLAVLPDALHRSRKDYIGEVQLAERLAEDLAGWSSATGGIAYPNGERPDLRCEADDGTVVTLEIKYFVLDWPTRRSRWDGHLARQHLGILPGKPNNGVHDVTEKLPRVDFGTHVGFLLVTFSCPRGSALTDIATFESTAGVDRSPWTSYARDWSHPTDSAHHVDARLWLAQASALGTSQRF